MVVIADGSVPDDMERCIDLWVDAVRQRDGAVDPVPVAERARRLFDGPPVRFAVAVESGWDNSPVHPVGKPSTEQAGESSAAEKASENSAAETAGVKSAAKSAGVKSAAGSAGENSAVESAGEDSAVGCAPASTNAVDRALIGFAVTVASMDREGTARLERIAVRPAAAGRGAGRLLLDDAVTSARGAGFGAIELAVRTGNRAVRLYEAAGFRAVSEPVPHPLGGAPMVTYHLDL